MTLRPSSVALGLGGIAVMVLGLYFVFVRPPLLPEDLRFLDTSLPQIQASTPALPAWLRHVFWVLGGYMIALGVVTLYVAVTAFRTRARGAAVVMTVVGASSVGGMALVNFLISSDFRWALLSLALLWALALVLYRVERPTPPVAPVAPDS